MTAASLQLGELRKEQRRLAALLNKPDQVYHIPKVKEYPRHEVPPFWAWCSHLDPEGNFRNPALDFLRQGLENVGKKPLTQVLDSVNKKKRVVLKAHAEEGSIRDGRDSGYSQTIDALVSPMRNESTFTGSNPFKLRYSKLVKGGLPPSYNSLSFGKEHGGQKKIRGRDIEEFGYSNLKKPLSLEEDELDEELKQLGLEELRGKKSRKKPRHGGIPFFVPENTPAPSTAAGKSRVSLPSIYKGKTGDRSLLVPDNSFVEVDSGHGSYSDSRGSPQKSIHSRSLSQGSHHNEDRLPPINQGQGMVSQQANQAWQQADTCRCSSPVLMKSRTSDSLKGGVCWDCGGRGGHTHGCGRHGDRGRKLRCSKCGLERGQTGMMGSRDHSKLMVAGSRQNTMVTQGERSLTRETTLGGQSLHRQKTDMSSPFHRIRSATELSEDSIVMDEIENRLKELESTTDYRLPADGKELSVSWKNKDQKEVFNTNDPPTYMNKMNHVGNILESGALDFHTDLNVNNIDTTLRISKTPESEDLVRSNPDPIGPVRSRKRKRVTRNAHREAYEKALSVAASSKLPQEAWMYFNRITPAYKFSYFDFVPRKQEVCPDCDKPPKSGKTEGSAKVKQKSAKKGVDEPMKQRPAKINEMKHIFGNIDINDYYPGEKYNTL